MPHQKYIVVFKKSASKDQIQKYKDDLATNGGTVTHDYGSTLNGFAAEIPDSFVSQLQPNDVIDYIEPDGVVTTQ